MRGLLIWIVWYLSINLMDAQISISGHMELDSSWNRVIYVSEIPSLSHMYRGTESMLVSHTKIDSNGFFNIHADLYYEEYQFLRLHVVKKGHPIVSLSIGGEDENFCFIAAKGNSRYQLGLTKGRKLWSHFNVKEDNVNAELSKSYELFRKMEDGESLIQEVEDRLSHRKQFVNEMYGIANTTNHVLSAIYATYLADLGFNTDELRQVHINILDRLGTHPYLPVLENTISYSTWLIGVFLFFLTLLIFYYKRQGRKQMNSDIQKVQLLSPRERKVGQFLLMGHTNKEIAAQLHVEISTVKSHVHKIYGKLEISNRAQIHRYKAYFN